MNTQTDGVYSKRDIVVLKESLTHLEGFCYLRGKKRTFLKERILNGYNALKPKFEMLITTLDASYINKTYQ